MIRLFLVCLIVPVAALAAAVLLMRLRFRLAAPLRPQIRRAADAEVARATLALEQLRAETDAGVKQLAVWTTYDRIDLVVGRRWTEGMPDWERQAIRDNHQLVTKELRRRVARRLKERMS